MLVSPRCDHDHDHAPIAQGGRSGFVQRAALGVGVSLLTPALLASKAHAAGKVDALLLSCMDFRLMDDVEKYMSGRGLRNKYDHIVLAGASLGAVTDKFPAWNKTFWEHLAVAIDLHKVHKVIVMDHRDCGAYKVILGTDFGKDPAAETKVHRETLKKLEASIKEKHPKLEVELLLMSLNGKVEAFREKKA
jgi:carbonic anhydrase